MFTLNVKFLERSSTTNFMIQDYTYMDVSENGGTPKSSILIGFSIINHQFWGTPIFGNTHIIQNMRTPILSAGVQKGSVFWPFYSHITTLQLFLLPWHLNPNIALTFTASLQLNRAVFFSSQHFFFQGEAERLSLCALLHAKHHRGAIAQRAMQRKLSCRETPRPAQPLGCKKGDRPSCR